MYKVGAKIRVKSKGAISLIKKRNSNSNVWKLPGGYSILTNQLSEVVGKIGTITEVTPDDDEGCEYRHIYWITLGNNRISLPVELLTPLNSKPTVRRPSCK